MLMGFGYRPGVRRRTTGPSIPTAVYQVLALQGVCVGGFIVSIACGNGTLAWAFLAGPVQVLVWFVLASSDISLLKFLVLMTPLAAVDLLPHTYGRLALFPVTLALLIVFRIYGFLDTPWRGGARATRNEEYPIVLLAGWMAASLLHAVARGWGSPHLYKFNILAFQIFVLGYFCASLPRKIEDLRGLVTLVALGGVVGVFLLPLVMGHSASVGILGGKRIHTSFGLLDLNALGTVVAGCSVALLGLLVGGESRRRFLHVAAVILLLLVLVYTRSRGAWLGFGVAFIYLMIRGKSFRLTIAGAGAGLAVLASDVLRKALSMRMQATSVYDPSLAGRLALWNIAWRTAKHNWLLGVGWENFRLLKPMYGFPTSVFHWTDYNAHNLYLEVLADLGFVGLALLLVALIGVVARTDQLARDRTRPGWSLALALNAALICFAVHGLLDCLTDTFALLGIWLGLAASLRRLSSPREVVTDADPAIAYVSSKARA